MGDQPATPAFEGECWTFDAWTYSSSIKHCDDMWKEWDAYCYSCDYNDNCKAVDLAVEKADDKFWGFEIDFEQFAMMKQLRKEHTNPEMAKQMFKN